jgi:hypothetical protein
MSEIRLTHSNLNGEQVGYRSSSGGSKGTLVLSEDRWNPRWSSIKQREHGKLDRFFGQVDTQSKPTVKKVDRSSGQRKAGKSEGLPVMGKIGVELCPTLKDGRLPAGS